MPPCLPRATAVIAQVLLLASHAAHAGPAPLSAQACLGCHGPAGRGEGAVPALAGRDARELRATLQAFRDRRRPATIMDRIARGYSEAELAIAADFFAGAQ